VGGSANGSKSEHLRALSFDGVAAQQLYAKCLECLGQSAREASIVGSKAVAKQHSDWFCALGGEIGQIARYQLPRDIGYVSVGPEMCALGHRIVGENQSLTANLQNRAIVLKPAGPFVER
jgi:hypothetical protein